jgi:hypothetical protein
MHGVSGRNSVVLAFVCIKTPSMEGSSKWERYSRSRSGKELISFVKVCLETVPTSGRHLSRCRTEGKPNRWYL